MSLSPPAAAQIRPMQRGDLPGVLDGWEALIQDGGRADPRYQATEDGRGALRDYLLHTVFGAFHPFPVAWVAVDERTVAGFLLAAPLPIPPLLAQPPTARILDLWIHPAHRRRGLGRALVRAFEVRAIASGHPWIEVGTLSRDPRALAFWRALGFDDWKAVLLRTP